MELWQGKYKGLNTSGWIWIFCPKRKKKFAQLSELWWHTKRVGTRHIRGGMKTRPWRESNDAKMRANGVTTREIPWLEHMGLNLKILPKEKKKWPTSKLHRQGKEMEQGVWGVKWKLGHELNLATWKWGETELRWGKYKSLNLKEEKRWSEKEMDGGFTLKHGWNSRV